MIYLYTEKYTPRIKYVTNQIFEKILCSDVKIIRDDDDIKKCEGPLICYSREKTYDNAFNICPHGLVFQDGIREQDITVSDWNGTKIFFETGNGKYDLPFDIFSAIFYLLSRYEEYGIGDAFKKEDSIAYKNGFLDRPLVDEWAYMLEKMLVEKVGYKAEMKHDFRVHSSVAIDNLFKYRHNSIVLSLGLMAKKLFTGNFHSLKHQLRVVFFLDPDPYDNIEKIFKLHTNVNLTPSFFVMVKKGQKDCYNIYTTFRKLKKALRRNYTTGLHPSLGSGYDPKKLRKELQILESKIVKQRVDSNLFHEATFSIPVSYESLLKIGIVYDYSMGYHDALGFRASTCTPFRFYDIKHESKTRLMVHSLVISDLALKTMGIHHNELEDVLIPLIDKIKIVNGQFCSVLSNCVFSEMGKWHGWAPALESVFKYASKLETSSIEKAKKLCR